MPRLVFAAVPVALLVSALLGQTGSTAPSDSGKPQPDPLLGGVQPTGIAEITLERTPCFGFCPVYTVTLYADGRARYEGKQHAEREGVWVTEDANPMYFNQLAQLAQAIKFRDLNAKYAAPVTDLPSAITTVKFGGDEKRVVNYGNQAPIELWGLEMAIDGVVAKLKWTKAGGADEAPKGND